MIAVPGEMELTEIKGIGRGGAIAGLLGWRELLESEPRLMKSRGLSSLKRGQEHMYMAPRRRVGRKSTGLGMLEPETTFRNICSDGCHSVS